MQFLAIRSFLRRWLPLLALALLASCGGSHDDLPFAFSTTLNSAEQVPPALSSGTGAGIVTVDPVDRTLLASVVVTGVNDTQAQLHEGRPGVNGPLIFSLAKETASGVWTARASVTDAQLAALRAGNYYFDVHSTLFPNGELRGQIFEQLPSSQQFELLQQRRAQSALLDQQLHLIERIEDELEFPHSGVGFGLHIGF